MRPSIDARSFWSFSTSKKPPQLAHTRFQILGIGDGDFSWHARKIGQIPANRKGTATQMRSNLGSTGCQPVVVGSLSTAPKSARIRSVNAGRAFRHAAEKDSLAACASPKRGTTAAQNCRVLPSRPRGQAQDGKLFRLPSSDRGDP